MQHAPSLIEECTLKLHSTVHSSGGVYSCGEAQQKAYAPPTYHLSSKNLDLKWGSSHLLAFYTGAIFTPNVQPLCIKQQIS